MPTQRETKGLTAMKRRAVRWLPPAVVGALAALAVGQSILGSTGKEGVTQPGPAAFQSAASGGDGFEALFVGNLIYNVHHHSSGNVLDCHDRTGARCTGYPTSVSGIAGQPFGTNGQPLTTAQLADASVIGTRIYYPAGVIGSTAVGVACSDVAGNPVATPFSTNQVANTGVNWVNYGSIAVIGPRVYFAESTTGGVATYTCWDYSTSSACAGFVPATSGPNIRTYTLRQDPVNPDCIWEEGDADRFEVFSATFGGTNCSQATTNVDIRPSSFYCDGQNGHVTGWDRIRISGVTPADFTAMAVTIADDNGDPCPDGRRACSRTR